jgi:hypothetical protein
LVCITLMIENANVSLHALNDITNNSATSKGAVLQCEAFEALLAQMVPAKETEAGGSGLLSTGRGLECIGAEAAQARPCFEGVAGQSLLPIEQGVDISDLGVCATKNIIQVGVEITAKDSGLETPVLAENAKRIIGCPSLELNLPQAVGEEAIEENVTYYGLGVRSIAGDVEQIASGSEAGTLTGEPVEEACVIAQEMLYGAVRARLRSVEVEIESDSEEIAAASNVTELASEISALKSERSEDVGLLLQRESNADSLERGQNSVKHDLLQGFIKPVQVEVSTAVLKYEEASNMQSVNEQIVAKIAIARSQ